MNHQPHPPQQSGYTLIEVMITTAILLVVIAILAPLLTGTLRTFGRQSDRSGALDTAALILQQMERDVLGSSVLNVVSPGNDLQLIIGQSSAQSCVEYRVASQASPQPLTLQRRIRTVASGSWPAGGGWQTLMSSLKLSGQPAGAVIPNPAGANPFTASGVPTSAAGAPIAGAAPRSVAIDLQVQNGTSAVNELKTTATGRAGSTTTTTSAAAAASFTAQCS